MQDLGIAEVLQPLTFNVRWGPDCAHLSFLLLVGGQCGHRGLRTSLAVLFWVVTYPHFPGKRDQSPEFGQARSKCVRPHRKVQSEPRADRQRTGHADDRFHALLPASPAKTEGDRSRNQPGGHRREECDHERPLLRDDHHDPGHQAPVPAPEGQLPAGARPASAPRRTSRTPPCCRRRR